MSLIIFKFIVYLTLKIYIILSLEFKRENKTTPNFISASVGCGIGMESVSKFILFHPLQERSKRRSGGKSMFPSLNSVFQICIYIYDSLSELGMEKSGETASNLPKRSWSAY